MPFEKLPIAGDKELTAEEQILVKESLRNGAAFFSTLTPEKNDYVDRYDRGTVKFNPKHRNYCFSKVAIPDGKRVVGCNFSQRKAGTVSITGKDLTFIDCNLTNNVIDPSWDVSQSSYGEVDFEKQEADEAKALAEKAVL